MSNVPMKVTPGSACRSSATARPCIWLLTPASGIRVLSKVLPGELPGHRRHDIYDVCKRPLVSGPSLKLPVSVIGTRPVEVNAQTVNDVRCQRNNKHCIAMHGYTGESGFAFSGVFGAGAAQAFDDCCTNPLRALPGNIGQRYLVQANFDKPFVIRSPSTGLTQNFTLVPMKAAQTGALQWPVGYVQNDDKMRFCAPAVFTTGSTGTIRVETDKAPNWTDDGDENVVLAQGNYDVAPGVGSWGHRYDSAQVTVARTKPGANRIVVGLTAMQNVGVLLDFQHAQLGLHAAKTSGIFAP
jgi:hypothetical protein